MKKQFALLVLILICSNSAEARVRHYNVWQLYAGEAKPRAEVVWMWLDPGVSIVGVDGVPVTRPVKPLYENSKSMIRECANPLQVFVVELFPGKHTLSLGYIDQGLGGHSEYSTPVEVDAKAGGDYRVQANVKLRLARTNRWEPTIAEFDPSAENFQARTQCRF
jgi:hypothetical protein